jgi:hypothetical protein
MPKVYDHLFCAISGISLECRRILEQLYGTDFVEKTTVPQSMSLIQQTSICFSYKCAQDCVSQKLHCKNYSCFSLLDSEKDSVDYFFRLEVTMLSFGKNVKDRELAIRVVFMLLSSTNF